MRVLFWGTPDFAVPTLRALSEEGHDVVGVVTQPDRPAGRGRTLTPSPVRLLAEAEGIPVLTPELPKGDDFLAELRSLDPEISVVVAYGHILGEEVLELPPRGSWNVHASLLPHLRGAAPVHWAIAHGDSETGVTVMRMTKGMDAGPILHQVSTPIEEDETSSELSLRLSEIGAQAIVEALVHLEFQGPETREQDHDAVTFAPKVSREVARIDWDRRAKEISDHVRAMDEVPGAWTTLGGQPLKLFRPTLEIQAELPADAEPGRVVLADPSADPPFAVMAQNRAVGFREVQPPGKRRMDADAWLRGKGAELGALLE